MNDSNICGCSYIKGEVIFDFHTGSGVHFSFDLTPDRTKYLLGCIQRALAKHDVDSSLPTVAEIRAEASLSDVAEGRVP